MWLARLDLLAFGHFTDVQLQLGPGFHIVYGPNEAGKSTTLRAIRQLLFGFDERTRDNFVHSNPNLRIAGLLRDYSGTELDVIRRKARKESLRLADDTISVDDNLWQKLLCGIDESTFSSRYGINYDQLLSGGAEIASGKGDLGEILFATGSGISDLTTIQRNLDEEAAELFRPQGKKQRINQAIVEWQEQRETISKSILLASEWEEIDQRRQQTQANLTRVANGLSSQMNEVNLRKSWLQASALVREMDDLERQLAALKSIPRLPTGFAARRQEVLLHLQQAADQERVALKTIEEAQGGLQQLTISRDLLRRADELSQLFADWGSYRKAQLDQPRLVEQFENHSNSCEQLLKSVGRSLDANEVELISIDRGRRSRINELGRRHAGLTQAMKQANDRCTRLRQQMGEIQQQLAQMPISHSLDQLRDAVRQSRHDGDLEAQLRNLREEIAALEDERRQKCRDLAGWKGSIDDLRAIHHPSIDAINQIKAELDAHDKDVSILKSRQAELESDHLQLRQQIDELQRDSDIPSQAQLEEARNKRDTILAEIEKRIASKESLSQSMFQSLRDNILETDRISDRLRNEASRVAQFSEYTADVAEIQSRQNANLLRLKELDAARVAIEKRWQSHWSDDAAVVRPGDALTWLTQRNDLLQTDAQLSRRSVEAKTLAERLSSRWKQLFDALRSTISVSSTDSSRKSHATPDAVDRLVPSISGQQLSFGWDQNVDRSSTTSNSLEADLRASVPQSLSDFILHVEELIERENVSSLERKDAEKAAARLTLEESELQQQLRQAKQELDEWQKEWANELVELKIEPHSNPDLVEAHLQVLTEISEHRRQAEEYRARISGIDADAEQFAAKVNNYCQEMVPQLLSLPISDAVTSLRDQLQVSQRNLTTFNELTTRKSHAEQQLLNVRESRTRCAEVIRQLCESADISCPELEFSSQIMEKSALVFECLKKLEADSDLRLRLEGEHERIRTRLAELADATPMEEFLRQTRQASAESLNSEIQAIELRCSQLAEDRDQLMHQLGGTDLLLRQMDGRSEAADAEEKQRQLLAQIRSDVEQYARSKLASSLLHLTVERYREKIRGPVLTVASELFRELTLDSFKGLRVTEDDHGNPILVGVRKNERDLVTTSGMSEGTCDQLYLALRLASLFQEAEPRNRLPFIVDDILIHFDDSRALAALRILARLSRQRQVIFFTHHQHLLEITEQQLAGEITIHKLGM